MIPVQEPGERSIQNPGGCRKTGISASKAMKRRPPHFPGKNFCRAASIATPVTESEEEQEEYLRLTRKYRDGLKTYLKTML